MPDSGAVESRIWSTSPEGGYRNQCRRRLIGKCPRRPGLASGVFGFWILDFRIVLLPPPDRGALKIYEASIRHTQVHQST